MSASDPRREGIAAKLAKLQNLDELAQYGGDEGTGALAGAEEDGAYRAARWLLGGVHRTGVDLDKARTSRLAHLLANLAEAERTGTS